MITKHLDVLYPGFWDDLSVLAAHAINTLGQGVGECCPHHCGPCGALRHLHDAGILNDLLRPYVEDSGGGWDWWDKDHVNMDWVTSRWCDAETCDMA